MTPSHHHHGRSSCASWRGSTSTDEPLDNNQSSSLDRNEQILQQRVAQSAEIDTLNRVNPTKCGPQRHVVVVVGVTGGGKSSTANTMRHSNKHNFAVSSSITSVTQSISHRDYSYDPGGVGGSGGISGGGNSSRSGTALTNERNKSKQLAAVHDKRKIDFRIIDTPGLQDTNRNSREIQKELDALVKLAPHGISAFVVCVPMGRVTEEHQAVLQDLVKLFGQSMIQHSVLVVTSARTKPARGQSYVLLTRNDLIEQMGKLPLGHFLREWVEGVEWRLVGVENVLEPFRTQSSLRLHQAVMDTVAANSGQKYQFDPNVFGKKKKKRQQQQQDLRHKLQELVVPNSSNNPQELVGSNIQCQQSVSQSKENNGKIILTISCEIDLENYRES